MIKQYHFGWQEKSSALVGIGHHRAFVKNKGELFSPSLQSHFVFWKNGQSHAYFCEESIKNWKEESKKFGEKGYVEEFLKESAKKRNEFKDVIKRIEEIDLKKCTNEELLNVFKEYYKKLERIQALYLASQPEGVDFVNTKLSGLLIKERGKENIEEEHKISTSSHKVDLIQQERIDFYNLLEKESTRETLREHAKKYPCFFFNTYKWEAVISYLKERAEKANKEEMKKEIECIIAQKEEKEKKKQELFLVLSDETKRYATTLMELGHDRLELKNCWSGAELLGLNMLLEIRTRINIPSEDFFATYTKEDVENALLHEEKLSEEEIKKRKQAMLYKVEKGEIIFKSGEEAERAIEILLGKQDFSQQTKVKGMVANNGVISGRVRIVLVEDIEKFQKALNEFEEGEILITTMTSPNMVPLIKKAAGIVTNEGGICSHAAIIARELTTPRKKPCIVGTKDATRIFRTGEYVLVDGKNGIITKIQKEQHEETIERLEKQLEAGGN